MRKFPLFNLYPYFGMERNKISIPLLPPFQRGIEGVVGQITNKIFMYLCVETIFYVNLFHG